jgi:hypothetical protein
MLRKVMDRRRFLRTSAATLAATSLSRRIFAQAGEPAVAVSIDAEHPIHTIPLNFIGLSYERQQLSKPEVFTAANKNLIAEFKALSPHGVLRLGGNTGEFSWWQAKPGTKPPERPHTETVVGEPNANLSYIISPERVRNLAAFLRAAGWTCIYGLNLGTARPEDNADEAAFVIKTLGDRLEYLQVGNEVDIFGRHLRDSKTWGPEAYLKDWLTHANAIRAKAPHAKFGIPDVASDVTWLPKIAALWPAVENKPQLVSLSHHYYFTGPPSNPKATIERLLTTDPAAVSKAKLAREAGEALKLPYRMTEGNTCYRGGKTGFSDVFAASLWAADYLLTLASYGYSGVNLHGGGGKEVADSLGGTLPGEELMPDRTVPHPRPFYTPINEELNGRYTAEPVNFGMRFAGMLAGATLLPVKAETGNVNVSIYAAKLPDGKLAVAVINKDAKQPITVNVTAKGITDIRTLTASSLEAHEAKLGSEMHTMMIRETPGPIPVSVPAASAKLVTFV